MRLRASAIRGVPRLAAPGIVILLAVVAIAAAVAVTRPTGGEGPRRGSPTGRTGALAPVLPAAGERGDATCTDPSAGTEWRVSWQAAGAGGQVVLEPTGFSSRRLPGGTGSAAAGGWLDRDLDTWQLRWSAPAQESQLGDLLVERDLRGSLAQLVLTPQPATRSPRFVSPDGACTVWVAPYGRGEPGAQTVAVLGDSLVAQLGPSPADPSGPGPVQRRLLERGERPEVTGQGGRRWTPLPGVEPGLDAGDSVLLDEIRGLRGARAQVIALGTNDAGWVALAPDEDQFQLRLAWVLFKLTPILDELRDSGQCAVLLTAEDRGVSYLGARPDRYAEAASRVDDLLREHAGASATDDLHLWDWAAISADHHPGSLDSWYGPDTVHLDGTGRQHYADELVNASTLC